MPEPLQDNPWGQLTIRHLLPGGEGDPFPDHPTTRILLDGEEVEVDERIAPLISAIFGQGIKSVSSCQDEDGRGTAWVFFKNPQMALRFVRFMSLFFPEFAFHWTTEEMDSGAYRDASGKAVPVFMVSIRFSSSLLDTDFDNPPKFPVFRPME